MTQRDIADIVGVSHAAVSQVLHQVPHSRVRPETRLEILRVAGQLGYEPRAMTTRTVSVAIAPKDFARDITATVLMSAEATLRGRGYRMSISVLSPEDFAQAPQQFSQKFVDGVIFTNWDGRAEHLHAVSVPWVVLADADDIRGAVDQIGPDTVQTARTLAEYLIQHGHRRLCVVTGKAGIGYHERFKRGVRQALESAGLDIGSLRVIHADDPRETGRTTLPSLAPCTDCTAVLTGSAGTAQLVLNRLQSGGVRVPEDLSLVSMVDAPRLADLDPAITATSAVGPSTVQRAVERLLQRIERPGTPPQRVFVPGAVIERNSVRSVTADSHTNWRNL